MKKKLFGILAVLCLFCSVFFAAPLRTEAATQSSVKSWMDSKMNQAIDFDGAYGAQCVDLFNHYLKDFWGFSNPIGMYPVSYAYQIFDYNAPSGWTKISGSGNYRVGDVVVWAAGNGSTAGHVGIVYSVDGSTVKIFQQNYNGMKYCTVQNIHWTSLIRGVFRPPLESGLSGSAVNLGDNFDAKIFVSGSDKMLFEDTDYNVSLNTIQADSSCYWNFARQSNGTYKITNKESGRLLDVYGAASDNGTNVQTWGSNDTNAQKWYIVGSAGSYQLAPACAQGSRLDAVGGTIAVGTNLQIYTKNGSDGQNFSIQKVDHDAERNPLNLGSNFYATITMTSSGKAVFANSDGNVELSSKTTASGSYWNFVRNSDGSYKIISMYDGKVLDVYGAYSDNETNVQAWTANNTAAQKWFITGSQGEYRLSPACASDKKLDVKGANTDDGVNIQIYTANSSVAQKFTINKITVNAMSGVAIGGKASDALRINWNKNTSASGYILEQYKNGSWTRIAKITSNSTVTYRVSGLTSSTTYKFRIRGYKMVGTKALYGSYSNVSGTTTKKTAASITELTVGGRASDAIRLNWKKSTSAEGYIIEQYKSGSWTRIKKITGNSTLTYRVSGLKAGTTYKFRIKTYVMNGSTASYSTYKTLSAKTLPNAVSNLVIGGTAKDALRLNWSKNTSAQGYIIEQQIGNKWTRVTKITSNATTTYRVSGLSSGKTYNFRVKTYTMDGSTPLYGSYVYVNGTTK